MYLFKLKFERITHSKSLSGLVNTSTVSFEISGIFKNTRFNKNKDLKHKPDNT